MQSIKYTLIALYVGLQLLLFGYTTIVVVSFLGNGWLFPEQDFPEWILLLLMGYFIWVNQLIFHSNRK